MLQNSVKRKLREGKAVVGTLLILGDLRFMTAGAKAARDAIKVE